MGSWTQKFDPARRVRTYVAEKTGTQKVLQFSAIEQAKRQTHKQGDPYFDPAPLPAKMTDYGPALAGARAARASMKQQNAKRLTIMGGAG